MSFIETPTFPQCVVRYGYSASPQYSVTISETASGHEARNANWNRSRRLFNVQAGPRMQDEIEEIYEFWMALGGPETGFRFKDFSDFKSCRLSAEPAATDQVLTLIPGSPGGYQLEKRYTAGTRARTRKILKPVQGTIKIANNGVLMTEGVNYLIDYTSGLMTLFTAPAGPITWGGEFDTPVRFDSEFPLELVNHQVQQVTFQLRELREATPED